MGKNYVEMMMNKQYDRMMEYAFEKMYEGGGESFTFWYDRILGVFEDVMNAGYLMYKTYNRLKRDLKEIYGGNECTVISCGSQEISVLSKENDISDRFSLTDLILWLVEKLEQDPIFRREMQGHYDYSGMINVLKKAKSAECNIWVRLPPTRNMLLYDSYIYMVDEEDGYLRLLKIENAVGKMAPESEELMPLSSSDLFRDKKENCICVNHMDGFGRKILLSTGKVQVLPGRVLSCTDQGAVIVNRGKLWIYNHGAEEEKIGDEKNIILNIHETEGISWIDLSKKRVSFKWYDGEKTISAHALKADVVWRYMIDHAYRIAASDFKMSTVLWKSKIFRTPVPFNKENILRSVCLIEQKISDGTVQKSDDYADILFPLLSQRDNTTDLTDALYGVYDIMTGNREIWKIRKMLRF